MSIKFNELITEKGIYLLIGTEEAARQYSKKYLDKGAKLETWLWLGDTVLDRENLEKYDRAIIL